MHYISRDINLHFSVRNSFLSLATQSKLDMKILYIYPFSTILKRMGQTRAQSDHWLSRKCDFWVISSINLFINILEYRNIRTIRPLLNQGTPRALVWFLSRVRHSSCDCKKLEPPTLPGSPRRINLMRPLFEIFRKIGIIPPVIFRYLNTGSRDF